jgi:hypothetical protein
MHRRRLVHPCTAHGCHTDLIEKLLHGQEIIMGVLEDLQGANQHFGAEFTALADEVTALADEQATFLADVADRLASAPDPAAVEAVAADISAKADAMAEKATALRELADQQRAVDPVKPDPGTVDPNQVA